MSAGMQRFLDQLIEEAENNVAELQIIFVPGTGANAGSVRKVEGYEDMYEMVTFSAPGGKDPRTITQADLVAVSMFFESDAVQRVMKAAGEDMQKAIVTAQPNIVVPGRH